MGNSHAVRVPASPETADANARMVAAGLARAGTLRITQGKAQLDPDEVLTGQTRGPLRFRR